MKTEDHLNKIKNKCRQLIEKAEVLYDFASKINDRKKPAVFTDVAGWQSTIILIEELQRISRRVPIMGSNGDYRDGQSDALEAVSDNAFYSLSKIMAIWPEEIL